MAKIKILKKPLTLRALKRRADKDGRISVNIAFSLDEVMTDIESFNDLADERDDTERVRRNSRLRELKEPERWIVKP